jgi:DNA-binding transcriptional MerR regulator
MDDELFSIGRFAPLSGVWVHALRHYDHVGLLAPAEVDAGPGCRRCRGGHVQAARLIGALRWIDLPAEQIRQILAADAGLILARHRDRLERQAA